MKNLVTKRYKGYTYHVLVNGDFYVYLKRCKKYAPFGSWSEPKEVITTIARRPEIEYDYSTTSRETMLMDAESEAKYAKTH